MTGQPYIAKDSKVAEPSPLLLPLVWEVAVQSVAGMEVVGPTG